MRGVPKSEEFKAKLRARTGELSVAWKGDKAKYRAIHMWIATRLNRPKRCTKCKKKYIRKDGVTGIHWANISGDYKRDLTDWVALCYPCHKHYDLSKKV